MSEAMRLVAETPAPLRPTPAVPPAAMAADPASTTASMVWWASALRRMSPVALMPEFSA